MKKLAIAAIVAAVLAGAMSGVALYRTRNLSSTKGNTTESTGGPAAGGLVEVPDQTNQNLVAAIYNVVAVNLKYKVVRTPSTSVQRQSIISQNPAPGTKVPVGTEVELTVSDGPPDLTVSDAPP